MKYRGFTSAGKVLFCFLCLSLLLGVSPLWAWRSYGRFKLGGDANGIGGAYVGDASSEIALNYNPAGIVQIPQTRSNNTFSFMYEVYSSAEILDILAWDVKFKFDVFPFFSFVVLPGDIKTGFSVATLFAAPRSTGDLAVRSLKFTAAYSVLPNLSLGFGIGPVLAFEGKGYGISYAFNAGLLWKIMDGLQAGCAFQSPINLQWTSTDYGRSLSEVYPMIAEAGLAYAVNERFFLFGSLEYIDADSIRYVLNDTDYSPAIGDNPLARLHPHFGIRFLEEMTGGHISLGMMIDSVYNNTGSDNQYLLTAGFRAYGKNMVYRVSLVDGLLVGLFYPRNTREEKVTVSFSFYL